MGVSGGRRWKVGSAPLLWIGRGGSGEVDRAGNVPKRFSFWRARDRVVPWVCARGVSWDFGGGQEVYRVFLMLAGESVDLGGSPGIRWAALVSRRRDQDRGGRPTASKTAALSVSGGN